MRPQRFPPSLADGDRLPAASLALAAFALLANGQVGPLGLEPLGALLVALGAAAVAAVPYVRRRDTGRLGPGLAAGLALAALASALLTVAAAAPCGSACL